MGHLMRDHRRQPVRVMLAVGAEQRRTIEEEESGPGDAERAGGVDLDEIDLPRRIRAEPLVVVPQGIGGGVEGLRADGGVEAGRRPERQQRAIDLLANGRVVVVGDQHEIAGRSGDEVPGDGAMLFRLGCQHAGGDDLEIVWSRHAHVIEGARRVGRVAKGGRLRQRPAGLLFVDRQDRIPVGQHPGSVVGVTVEDAVGTDRVGRHGRGKGQHDFGALAGVD